MRERERLDDFRGGHVACRGCKRLLWFEPDTYAAIRCCDFAYAPVRQQIDLVIYDRLDPGDFPEIAQALPAQPVVIATLEDDIPEEEDEEAYELNDAGEAEVAAMVATPEQIIARRAERLRMIQQQAGTNG